MSQSPRIGEGQNICEPFRKCQCQGFFQEKFVFFVDFVIVLSNHFLFLLCFLLEKLFLLAEKFLATFLPPKIF